MIAHSTIERIKDIPIQDVIGKYIDLKPAGNSFRASSPWTEEKTPSFYVVPKKGIFKCFSTGKGGDAITFVMALNNMKYPDAIVDIAGKFGERVEYEETAMATEQQAERESLYEINRAALRRYVQQLTQDKNNPAWAELTNKRQFTEDTIIQWQLGYAPLTGEAKGYAPDARQFLTRILHEVAKIEPALKIGLVKQKDQVVYDVYHNRIMYPIHDHLGRLAGFGGGWLGTKDEYNPKYLNPSSESPLYDKKAVLFGLHFADPHIRKLGYANLVEGYTDVIALHQAGFEMTVGTCGTSLTEEQCKLLRKYCSKVVLLPDGDVAGTKSAMRNIPLLMKHGFTVALCMMPTMEDARKIDPDDLVRLFNNQPEPEPMKPVGLVAAAMELDKNDPQVQKLLASDGKKKATKRKEKF